MTATVETAKAFLFAGKLYVRFYDPLTNTFGEAVCLEVSKFEIKPEFDRLEALSNKPETYGQPFFSMALPKPTVFSIDFAEVTRELFAALMASRIEALTVAAAAFEDIEVTPAAGLWISLGRRHINPTGFTLTDEAGDITYVLGADYQVDWDVGLLKWLKPNAPAKALASGAVQATAGARLHGAQQYDQIMGLTLNGINLATKENVIVSAPRASVAPDAAHNFMQRQLATVPLTGRLEIPPDGGAPYTIDWLKAA